VNTEIDGNIANSAPVDYTQLNYTEKQIDSIAVYGLDFVTPGEGAGLLCYYYDKTDHASGTAKEQLKRKYKDIYDILKGNYGSAFLTAVEKVNRKTGIDLTRVYEEYAGMLATADDGGTYTRETIDSAALTEDVVPEGVTDAEVSESDGFIIVSPTAGD
ncbi:MAG: hypothetical protein K2H74_08855, partial [Paramuribaculum sp.]|nr:hypothetical protein [Paramuribaculum sp.]